MKTKLQTAGHTSGYSTGFTLVELMIALAIGMILALAMSQIFSNSRLTQRSTEDTARMQESDRTAALIVGRIVRMAGYKSNPTADSAAIFPATDLALTGADGTSPSSDSLVVRFQGSGAVTGTADNTLFDCLGQAVAPDFAGTAKSFNSFYIAAGADGRNALFCSTNPASPTAGSELVPGIEAMQIVFGEDTNADGSADRFLSAGGLTAATSNNVVVVRVSMLLSGAENVRLGAGSGVTYTMAGQAYSYSDQKVRRMITHTIVLRNRAP